MNRAYIFQSSLILYFFSAAGNTFQHGSSSVTRNDFAALCAASFALDRSLSDGPAENDACAEGGFGLIPVSELGGGTSDELGFAELEECRCEPVGGVADCAEPDPAGEVAALAPRIELSDISRVYGGRWIAVGFAGGGAGSTRP